MEYRREFRQGMFATFVNLNKMSDSVHHEALCNLRRLRGNPADF